MGYSLPLCGCCSVKDCGPMCCINEYFCGQCIWGSVMEKGGQGSCVVCCLAISCFPCCTLIAAGQQVSGKYQLEEGFVGACCKATCCPCCYAFQIQHEIMVKENLHYGCMAVEADGGAPNVTEMER